MPQKKSIDPEKTLVTSKGVIAVASVLTLIVLLESMIAPWAPYFIVYAILAFVIPIVLRTYRFGSFREVMLSSWKLILIIVAADLIIDPGITGFLYGKILTAAGLGNDPFYSVDAASTVMFQKVTQNLGIDFTTSELLFAFFILIWAPFGEELFYRGYMYGTLRMNNSIVKSSLVSSGFFGIRHATHFFYLIPDVPYVAAGMWALSAFAAGLMLNYLYEKTNSLYPCFAAHLLINMAWIPSII